MPSWCFGVRFYIFSSKIILIFRVYFSNMTKLKKRSFLKLKKTVIFKTLINVSWTKNNWRKYDVRKDGLHDSDDFNDVQWYIDNACTYVMS